MKQVILSVVFLAAFQPMVKASVTYDVTINTGALMNGQFSGPYALDFNFTNGSGTEGNNTATLTNFKIPSRTSPVDTITIQDGTGSEQRLFFSPYTSLSFRITLTTNVDPGTQPDEFSFAILAGGTKISTSDSTNSLLRIDESINASAVNSVRVLTGDVFGEFNPTAQLVTFAPVLPPPGPGPRPGVGAPDSAPEPASWGLFSVGIAGLLLFRRKKGQQRESF